MTLLSLQFVLLLFVAALFVWSSRGRIRDFGFLAVSGYFVFTYLGTSGTIATLTWCVCGYCCAIIVHKRPRLLSLAVTGAILTFIYARNYSFLEFVLPENIRTDVFRTAGLSFLLFKILHVLIDSAGGTISQLPFLTYVNYCFNFTTFLLGPIQRYQDFESQWDRRTVAVPATFEAHLDAVNRILRGMVKKFVFAEHLTAFALHFLIDWHIPYQQKYHG